MGEPEPARAAGRRFSPFGACLLLVSACGPALYPEPVHPITDPDVLIARLDARRRALGSLSAVARVETYSRRGVAKGRVTILADAAGRLRVDAWTPSDDLVAALRADPDGFLYYERGANECVVGPSCPGNVGRLIPIGLDVRDACAALFGFPRVLPATTAWGVSFDRREGAYRLESGTARGSQRIWVRDDGVPVRAEYVEAGRVAWRLDAGDFKTAGGEPWPHRLHFATARDDTDVTVRYRSLDPRAHIAPEDWAFDCPQGVPVRSLPCEGGS